MAAPALARVPLDPLAIRRFDLPDLDRHGRWLLPRLIKSYPHLTERSAIGWLRGIIEVSEFCFRFQTHSVGLAQVLMPSLSPRPVLMERFVWCEDPEDKGQQEEAAQFYTEFHSWARNKNIETMTDVGSLSDVPIEMIKAHLPRMFERKMWFTKVKFDRE